MQPTQPEKSVPKTWKPTVAGILEIIDAAGSLIWSFILLIAALVLANASTWAGFSEKDIDMLTIGPAAVFCLVLGIFVLALAILELIGGIFALKRKKWGLALSGSIAAALPFNILGILAIIFLAMSKDEFV
jgi:hypothetical protein